GTRPPAPYTRAKRCRCTARATAAIWPCDDCADAIPGARVAPIRFRHRVMAGACIPVVISGYTGELCRQPRVRVSSARISHSRFSSGYASFNGYTTHHTLADFLLFDVVPLEQLAGVQRQPFAVRRHAYHAAGV